MKTENLIKAMHGFQMAHEDLRLGYGDAIDGANSFAVMLIGDVLRKSDNIVYSVENICRAAGLEVKNETEVR